MCFYISEADSESTEMASGGSETASESPDMTSGDTEMTAEGSGTSSESPEAT